jgi:hypothetical protein
VVYSAGEKMTSYKCPHPNCKCYQTSDVGLYRKHLAKHWCLDWLDIEYLVKTYDGGTGI